MSKIFRGTNPRTLTTGSDLEHNEQGRQLSNAGPACVLLYWQRYCTVLE